LYKKVIISIFQIFKRIITYDFERINYNFFVNADDFCKEFDEQIENIKQQSLGWEQINKGETEHL